MDISNYIVGVRVAKNMNRREFAQDLCRNLDNKHSAQWIKNWEDGKAIPSGDFLGLLFWAYEPGEWQYQFALQIQGMKVTKEATIEASIEN